jgi:hypothetical protein
MPIADLAAESNPELSDDQVKHRHKAFSVDATEN